MRSIAAGPDDIRQAIELAVAIVNVQAGVGIELNGNLRVSQRRSPGAREPAGNPVVNEQGRAVSRRHRLHLHRNLSRLDVRRKMQLDPGLERLAAGRSGIFPKAELPAE